MAPLKKKVKYEIGNGERKEMDTLDILRTLAIILISSKLFGLLARDLKAPQVAGEIIARTLIVESGFPKRFSGGYGRDRCDPAHVQRGTGNRY